MNALYFIPIFSVVLAGLLFPRAGANAANISLVAGCIILILGTFFKPFKTWAEVVHPFHFIGLVFLGLMAFQYAMSLFRPLPEPWEHRRTGTVDMTPWRWAKPVGFGIIAFVIALYLAFADISALAGG